MCTESVSGKATLASEMFTQSMLKFVLFPALPACRAESKPVKAAVASISMVAF
jgi:hypothetical protein